MHQRKTRVVHIIEGFLGGTSTYMCTVLPELVERGFDVTLIVSLGRCSPDAHSRLSRLSAGGVKVHVVPMCRQINPIRDIRSFVGILRLLLRHRYDIVHTHCSKAGALGRLASTLAGRCAKVHTPHCFAFMRCGGHFRRWLYLGLEKALGKLTTKLVAVSRSEAATATSRGIVRSSRCVWVRNGLLNGERSECCTARPTDKTSLGIGRHTRVVATACRLVEYKGIFRFLQAAAASRSRDTVFVVAGEGQLKGAAEQFIRHNNLEKKTRLLGHVADMEQLYAICDVVALCSDAEGQPYLLLEAMRAGCPIVATSVVGNTELISQHKTGILAEPTPESIAGAVDELLARKDKQREYAANAYAYFREHHTLEAQVSELERIYRTII